MPRPSEAVPSFPEPSCFRICSGCGVEARLAVSSSSITNSGSNSEGSGPLDGTSPPLLSADLFRAVLTTGEAVRAAGFFATEFDLEGDA